MAFSEEWPALDSIKGVGVSKVDNFDILGAKYLEAYRFRYRAQYSPQATRVSITLTINKRSCLHTLEVKTPSKAYGCLLTDWKTFSPNVIQL